MRSECVCSMSEPWLSDLTSPQREAVTCGDGPLLIIAGAGTGKTRTLVSRVARLIGQGVSPERILLLTFTRRSAAEMISRAQRLIEHESGSRVWGGTFHATANRLLRIYGQAVDLPPDFTVMDESDAGDLMGLIRAELGYGSGKKRFVAKQTLVKIYSHTVNAQRSLDDVLARHFPWCGDDRDAMALIFDAYIDRKKAQHVLDYDDLLLFWAALCDTPKTGPTVADRFLHILVDEYQDTNALQAQILKGMRQTYRNLTVVGDDAQSIYSFRAASIRNILDFPEQFPGAHVVTLEQNYRSTNEILDASNAVMAQATQRYTKELFSQRGAGQRPVLTTCRDEDEQTESVIGNILEHLEQGVALMRQAVLFRASHHSALLEVALARRNIPFHKYGGLRFIEAAHIKDLLAFLRVLENPYDELSWYRILHMFDGVGPKTAQRIMAQLGVRGVPSPSADAPTGSAMTPLARLLDQPPAVPVAARESLQELRRVLALCCGRTGSGTAPITDGAVDERPQPPSLAVQVDLVSGFYEPIFERLYDNAAVRSRDLEQLVQIASRYRSRSRFITDLTLDPPNATSDLAQPPFLEEDYLILSTIHSAKGCEWDAVHIIHAADGMIPSDMAVSDEAGVDEERRLLYVAMTRAKDRLYVYFPLRYYHTKHRRGDAYGYAQLSRYLTKDVVALFEQHVFGDAVHDAAPLGVSELPAVNPRDRVRKLWGG